MSAQTDLPREAVRFLRHVEQSLVSLQSDESSEIVAELRAHLEERFAAGGLPAVEESLDSFGPPESYAGAFMEGATIRAAIASRSVRSMLVETLRLAGRGVGYFLTSLLVLVFYALALGLGLTGVLKPLFPDRVGVWSAPDESWFVAGILLDSPRIGSVEHLGYWIIPLSLCGGLILFTLANLVMRRTLLAWLNRSLATPWTER